MDLYVEMFTAELYNRLKRKNVSFSKFLNFEYLQFTEKNVAGIFYVNF